MAEMEWNRQEQLWEGGDEEKNNGSVFWYPTCSNPYFKGMAAPCL